MQRYKLEEYSSRFGGQDYYDHHMVKDDDGDYVLYADHLDAIEAKDREIAEKKKQLKILTIKCSGSLANNLCPDHRDKQAGKSCLACQIESKDGEIAELKRQLKMSELIRTNEKKILIEEIAKNTELRAKNERLKQCLFDIKLWCEGATCEICGVKEMKDTDCYDYVMKALKGET
jgi:hypothetical protein